MSRGAGQTRFGSAVEAMTNTAIGFVIALGAQVFIAWHMELPTTFAQDLLITTFFTGISIIRGYLVRRWFNWMAHR